MLNPKQHAKIEVLKQVSNMMDKMMSSKMKKKPSALSVEAIAVPKHDELHESMGDELAESPAMEKSEGSSELPLHIKGQKQPSDTDLDESDISRLRDHYSSLK